MRLQTSHTPCTRRRAASSRQLAVSVRASQRSGASLQAHGAALVTAISLIIAPMPAIATGLESVDILPGLESIQTPEGYKDGAAKELAKLKAADETFENSDTLKRLLAKSEENREKNKQAIADKYCYRQAELGVGDCGGLRYIPGLTQSGKQRTPDWLADLLGIERAPVESEDTLTLKDLFGGKLPE